MIDNSPGIFTLFMVFMGGAVLGAFFFGGLWWTVQKGLRSAHIGTWFLTSSVLRIGLAILGIYLITYGEWSRLVACLIGFIGARFLVLWLTSKYAEKPEVDDAP
jgi:F1F0 ATPase subunit 2